MDVSVAVFEQVEVKKAHPLVLQKARAPARREKEAAAAAAAAMGDKRGSVGGGSSRRASPALSAGNSKRKVSGSEGSSSANTMAWVEGTQSAFPWSGKRVRGSENDLLKSKFPTAPWNLDVQQVRSKWDSLLCYGYEGNEQQQQQISGDWGNNYYNEYGTEAPPPAEVLKDPYGCYFGSSGQSFR